MFFRIKKGHSEYYGKLKYYKVFISYVEALLEWTSKNWVTYLGFIHIIKLGSQDSPFSYIGNFKL